ncbi:PREDICTED: uncharacterized protein LOC106340166 [Brassica oleracea var. oleracea]|uniref:uncharacterized protein LOC106340166 n=1 Tax=Brassica oleracea var. oleracea TaxID=109376 RepID=UPI0006A6D7EB|nr:PREDICTED: uncharacterized protein LOC106340166 [Brassica oleracea var. oleracea]
MKEFASDLERDLDELCKNEKHHTQLKEETLSHREGWQRTKRKQKWSKSRRFKFKINPEEQLGSCLTFSGHSLKDDCTENEAWFKYIKTTLGRGVPFQILLENFYGKKLHGCMVLMVLEQVTDRDTLVPQHTPFKGFKFQHVKNVDWLITVFVLSWLRTTSKKGKAEIIQRDSTESKPEKLQRASKHRMYLCHQEASSLPMVFKVLVFLV